MVPTAPPPNGNGDLITLDVSLRDGGFLNDWRFSKEQILEHVRLIDGMADVIEVGYLADRPRPGLAGWLPSELLAEIRAVGLRSRIAVMVRPRPTAEGGGRGRLGLEGAAGFGSAESLVGAPLESCVDIVRLPTVIGAVEPSLECCAAAKERGLAVCINLTNVSASDEAEVLASVERLMASGADVLYVADSRGALDPESTERLIRRVAAVWPGDLGFHAHDNLGFAATNTERAVESGCRWADASVDGVGLGGRNLGLERLLELQVSRSPNRHTLSPGAVERLRTAAEALDLPVRGPDDHLYRLGAQANLNQEWLPLVVEEWGSAATDRLRQLPRRNYRSAAEALTAIRQLDSKGTRRGSRENPVS